jgi:DNA-directed RNA polymerase specialized sigma24 family protein
MAKWPRYDPAADRRLARAISEGGEESLAALYDAYAERLRDYCGSLIRDQRTATDIVHDTLIDAHRRVRRMRDRTRLRAWLYAGVRRRCLQRLRHPVLRWDWGGEPADAADGRLLETAFDRLDFLDQEALLLTLRHDLTGDDLGALLGVPARRASARVVRALARAEQELAAARQRMVRRCAAGELPEAHDPEARAADAGGPDAGNPDTGNQDARAGDPPGSTGSTDAADRATEPIATAAAAAQPATSRHESERALAGHVARCAGCRRRAELSLPALLTLLPVPALPSSLRHRVIHTGTDPELAGYRADIAARGGALNADGLPRQPDIPSSFARRWLFTTGGIAGAAVTAVVAAFLIGPGTPIPGLIWPSYRPSPPPVTPTASDRWPAGREAPEPPAAAGGGGGGPGGAAAPATRPPAVRSPTPAPTGGLTIQPNTIDFGQRDTMAKLTLSAPRAAPLGWRATASSDRITLSPHSGTLSADGSAVVTVTFERALIELPGKGSITVVDSAGGRHDIAVVWNASLL